MADPGFPVGDYVNPVFLSNFPEKLYKIETDIACIECPSCSLDPPIINAILDFSWVIFVTWLLINWLMNVIKSFRYILKHYFLQTNAAKFVKCML